VVAAKILEVVSGQPYEAFFEQRFFEPLGMTSTSATYVEHQKKGLTNVAAPHAVTEFSLVSSHARMFDPVAPCPWVDIGRNAAGSIMSTVTDCSAWLRMLMNGGEYDGRRVLSPEVVRELTRAQIVIKPEEDQEIGGILGPMGIDVNILAYGLGWWVGEHQGRYMVFHGGQWLGSNTVLFFMPQEKLGIGMFLNTTQTVVHAPLGFYIVDAIFGSAPDYSARAAMIMKAVEAQAREGARATIDARDADIAPTLPLEAFVGTYSSDLFGEIQISLQGEQLFHQYGTAHSGDALLEHWQGNTFLAHYDNRLNDPEFIVFQVEDAAVKALYMPDPDYPSDTFYRV
jgi:CubicO group peptidase (beta-lactamase class C family)